MKRYAILLIFLIPFLSGCSKEPDQVAYYALSETEENLPPPAITLFEDGTFSFFFSPLSSYMGHGVYKETEDEIVLTTDDNEFQYIFVKTEDCLRFDAVRSSDVVQYSGVKDGSVFIEGKEASP